MKMETTDYDVFVQEYSLENNQEIMEGTEKYPFRIVGILVDYSERQITVKCPRDDTFCCAPVLHRLFKGKSISLSFRSQYIQNVTPILVESKTDGDSIFSTFLLE